MDIPYIKASDLKSPAEILKSARLEKGLSMRELAQKVNCSHVHLLKIERGEKRPTARLLDKLQRELGLPPFQIILSTNGHKGTLPKVSTAAPDDEIIRLPHGCGTVVALLLDALRRGGYQPTLQKPPTKGKSPAAIITIDVDMGTEGHVSIPVLFRK